MRKLREKGISLLEVLVAMAVFGLMLGALMTMMAEEWTLVGNSGRLLKARLKANEVMETLKVSDFDELQSSSSFISAIEPQPQKVHVEISDFDDSENLKKIVVTVTWRDVREREQQYTLVTLRSRFSPGHVKHIENTTLTIGVQGG